MNGWISFWGPRQESIVRQRLLPDRFKDAPYNQHQKTKLPGDISNLGFDLARDKQPDTMNFSYNNTMIPSKIIGRPTGENWVGLIDGFYSIVLTLLVIELPSVILETVDKIKHNDNNVLILNIQTDVWIALGVVILGYFTIFTIIYDIWSYHKTLLIDAKKLRVFAITTCFILFISSLMPPSYYLVHHFTLKEVIGAFGHDPAQTSARIGVFGIITIIYLLLAVLAKSEKRQPGQTPERREELEYIFESSSTKALITVIIAGIVLSPTTYLPPPFGITSIAIITFFPINFFKKRSGMVSEHSVEENPIPQQRKKAAQGTSRDTQG